MPSTFKPNDHHDLHTDELQDIITAVPSWTIRWGITCFFCTFVLIGALSALIRYPDIVNATLKISSPDSPKPVAAKIQGKLIKILVKENETVKAGQPLGYIESTGRHEDILHLSADLKQLQNQIHQNKPLTSTLFYNARPTQFGELQAAYQTFFQECLTYRASVQNGFYVQKRTYLQKDIADLNRQQDQLQAQKQLQQQDFSLAEDEYKMHQKLANERVETSTELRQEESKYLAKKFPLIQTDAAILAASINHSTKQKEILELDNQINQEKSKFLQALNSLISQTDDWISKYVLAAPQAGKLIYAGMIQEKQLLNTNQEVFYVNPGNEAFFGEMAIPQNSMGKIKEGQEVLIKLKSYPFEEYGMLRGKISSIGEVPFKDSVFLSRVDFKIRKISDMKQPIRLKQGMMADAEIITQDATILQRICRNVIKVLNTK